MAYRIPAGMNFPGGMPGEPAAPPTPHTVSTGVRKTVDPQVKGHVTYGVKRPRTGRPANPKPPKPRPTRPKPGKPAPGPSDDALIQAATRLRFGPQEQGFTQQLGANTNYSAGIPGWYANALSEIRALQGQGQQTSQQNLAQIQSYNSQPALQNPTDIAAADARNNLNSQYGAMVGRDANANSAFMDRLAAANAVAQGNALAGAGRDRQQILAGQTALKGQEGDFGTTYGAGLASSAAKQNLAQQHENAYEEIARRAGLLKENTYKNVQLPLAKSLQTSRSSQERTARSNVRIKKAQLAEKTVTDNASIQAKNDAARVKTSGDSLKRSQFIAKYGLAPEKVAKMTPGQLSNFATKNPQFSGYARPPKGAAGKAPTTYQLKGRSSILDAVTRYQTDVKHGRPLHEIAADGRNHKVAEPFLHAGADAVSHGFITPGTVKLLQETGYTVPKEWTRPGAFPVTYKRPKKK